MAGRARERYLSAGFVSFDGLLRLTRDLLARDPAVRRELGARHRVILVDEFQDTDPLQYEILFYLAETPGSAAEDKRKGPGNAPRPFAVPVPDCAVTRGCP